MLKPGIYYNLPIDAYHGDKASLSSTYLRSLIAQSPMKAEYNRLNPMEQSDAMALGTFYHTMILEPETFESTYAIRPEKWTSWRSDGAKNWKAEQKSSGLNVCAPEDLLEWQVLKDKIENDPLYQPFNDFRQTGKPEVSLVWYEPTLGLTLRARPDWVDMDTGILYDLKTTQDSSPRGFRKKVEQFDYALQAYLNMRGFRMLTGRDPQAYIWLALEPHAPFDFGVYRATEETLLAGKQLFFEAVRILKECRERKTWPSHGGFENEILDLNLSNYYLNMCNER